MADEKQGGRVLLMTGGLWALRPLKGDEEETLKASDSWNGFRRQRLSAPFRSVTASQLSVVGSSGPKCNEAHLKDVVLPFTLLMLSPCSKTVTVLGGGL